jgi:AcrR family transcriptional regulator
VLYHFKDKKLLYRAVLDDLFGGLLEVQRAYLMANGSLADRLEDAVCAFVDFMGEHPTAARLAMRELIYLDPEIREEFHATVRPYLVLLEMIFAEGEGAGVFRPVRSDPYHFLSTIAGSTLFYVAALPTLVDEMPYDRLSEEQLDAHKRDLLEITRRLLGIRRPRALSDHSLRACPKTPDRVRRVD